MDNPCGMCIGNKKYKGAAVKCCYELCEQSKLVRWLDIYGSGIIFSATAQSTWTNYKGIATNQKAGVRPGVPDMIICLPAHITKCGRVRICFVEMKRLVGSNTPAEQKEWRNIINKAEGDVEAVIIKGGEAAIYYMEYLLKPKIEPDETPEEREISLGKKLDAAQKPFRPKVNNAKGIPAINYESDIKVEDLPF